MTTMRILANLARAAGLLALIGAAGTALAAPTIRPEVKVERDVVTLGDLIDGVDPKIGATPLFGAPRLGEHGTIQVLRVIEAAASLGLTEIDSGAAVQVTVSRPARRIGLPEVEKALREAVGARQGRDAGNLAFVYDSALPVLVLPMTVDGPLTVEDFTYDPRARRIAANLAVAARDGSRRRTLRVTGAVIETAPVAVLNRAINRGDRIEPGDVVIERRPRETVLPDTVGEVESAVGLIARRSYTPGTVLRGTDLAKPEVVQRGDVVTLVYETAGMTLTTRGKASQAGGIGDTITVENLQSKRSLQGTVTAPGRITVTNSLPGRVAINNR